MLANRRQSTRDVEQSAARLAVCRRRARQRDYERVDDRSRRCPCGRDASQSVAGCPPWPSVRAIWTIRRFAAASCQCSSSGSKQTRSPGRISLSPLLPPGRALSSCAPATRPAHRDPRAGPGVASLPVSNTGVTLNARQTGSATSACASPSPVSVYGISQGAGTPRRESPGLRSLAPA